MSRLNSVRTVTLRTMPQRRLVSRASLWLLAALPVLVASCAHVPPNPVTPATFGRVEGRVLDMDGAPIAHLQIRIVIDGEVFARETNRSGVFVFSGLAPRPTYTVCIIGAPSSCAIVDGPTAAPLTFTAMGRQVTGRRDSRP